MHEYHSFPDQGGGPHCTALLLMQSLRRFSLGRKRSPRDATRTWPDRSDSRQRAYSGTVPQKTVRPPSARSEHRTSRVVARIRNHPKSTTQLLSSDRLLPVAQRHSAAAPASKLVWQSALHQTACQSSACTATDLRVPREGGADDQASDTRARPARNKLGPRVLPILAWLLDIAPPA